MSTKELMAIRKLVSQHGIDAEQFVKALKRDSGNPRLIPDPRDKADRTRIFKRGGKLIGKDLMADAPEKMSISVAPDQVALLTADGLRYMQQYSDTEDAYLLLKKTDYNYIQMEIKALNELLNKSKANPDDAELDVEVRKTAFDLSKTVSTRFNRELDVERIMNRQSDGGLQYALIPRWHKI
jgi:predicted DNA binding CopG/RHH family protein